MDKKIEEYMSTYPSIRNWFIKPDGDRRYAPSTERMYIRRMEIWCDLVGKTPDELAKVDNIDRMRGIIAVRLRKKFIENGRRTVIINIVRSWINSLNRFWNVTEGR